jgi:hypothetical protein
VALSARAVRVSDEGGVVSFVVSSAMVALRRVAKGEADKQSASLDVVSSRCGTRR